MTTKQQARRAYVLLENTEVYRLGERRPPDWLLVGMWAVIGAVSGAVMAGGVFVLWLGAQIVWRLVRP